MRVVYDTSTLVTIFSRRGEILKFKSDVISHKVIPITSDYILEELEEVLTRKFQFTRQRSKVHSRSFARLATVVSSRRIQRISRDVKDDPILATALAGDAKYLVTLDDDLLTLKRYNDITIVTLEQFKKILAEAE